MSTSISPENEQFLQRAVADGRFADQGQALDAAIQLLRNREELRAAINRGVEQLDQGPAFEYEATQVDQFVADIEAHARRTLTVD